MVGKDNSDNQTFKRTLKQLVKDFELEKQFTFIDWLEDTTPLLSALDIFVSPSHSESFGLATLEAMASRTTVITTETEGAKELIKDNISGKLVPIQNPLKLAETICEIVEDSKKCRILGNSAQEYARENFSLERMILETERLYQSIIS